MESTPFSTPHKIKQGSSNLSEWDMLLESLLSTTGEEWPKFTVIIPSYQCCHFLTITLDSLIKQDYPDLEIIVIDASSPDSTGDVVRNYNHSRVRLYTVTEYNAYEMINRGISLCTGRYVNVLYPGDFYLGPDTLRHVAAIVHKERHPDVVLTAAVLREIGGDAKLLFRPLSLEYLQRGKQPTSLQACWWRIDTLVELGRFDRTLFLRGGYDLMCRFAKVPSLRAGLRQRVLVDQREIIMTYSTIFIHFRESMRIILRYFGVKVMIKWLWKEKDLSRGIKLWSHRLKVAFGGR